MEETIKVLLVERMKKPRLVMVDNTLKGLQNLVSGQIQVVYPWDDPVVLVCDEDGKRKGKMPNRVITDLRDIVHGPFFICETDGDEFASISDEMAEKYSDRFRWGELFVSFEDKVFGRG